MNFLFLCAVAFSLVWGGIQIGKSLKGRSEMRIAGDGENLVGKVCVCSVGRVAVVTGRHTFDWGESWVGLGLDGKGTWASTQPCIVAESGQEFHDKLLDRFGGKMTYNS